MERRKRWSGREAARASRRAGPEGRPPRPSPAETAWVEHLRAQLLCHRNPSSRPHSQLKGCPGPPRGPSGPVFSREQAGQSGPVPGPWHSPHSRCQVCHPWPWALAQAARARHAALGAAYSQTDGRAGHSSSKGCLYCFTCSRGHSSRPHRTGPAWLAHARRRAGESPGPRAPPPSLAKPEQMSADKEALTEQGCWV